jgi:hypothetical protein
MKKVRRRDPNEINDLRALLISQRPAPAQPVFAAPQHGFCA